MVRRLVIVAMAVAFVMAMTLPASAGPAATARVVDFTTQALDGDGCFKSVDCSFAHQVDRGDIVKETYHCQFVDDAYWGTPVLPESAVVWDYENTKNDLALPDWEACTVPIEPPYRWFSDVEHILFTDNCFMYTNPFGEDIGDSSFRMVVTPSGNVNITVVYDPPVFQGDCS